MRNPEGKKRLLIALPCLAPTGGINVVVNLVEVLQKMGYQINLVSRQEGEMRAIFEGLGVGVEIRDSVVEEDYIVSVMEEYDEVLVNTLQMCAMIYRLNGTDMPVKWWIHEPPAFFDNLSASIPQEFWDGLAENVKIYAAGNIVHNCLSQRYGKESTILNFGITDQSEEIEKLNDPIVSKDKITFLVPSVTIHWLKGQDILALAIAELPEEYQKRAEFIFVGCVSPDLQDFYNIICALIKEKENVKFVGVVEREILLSLMKAVDCIITPSREDTTNACIVEGMMLSKLCMCSNMTGISYYMEDCVNGFVFPTANVDELRTRIMLIIDNFDRLNVIAQNGRKVYEENFAMDVFEKNVREHWEK